MSRSPTPAELIKCALTRARSAQVRNEIRSPRLAKLARKIVRVDRIALQRADVKNAACGYLVKVAIGNLWQSKK